MNKVKAIVLTALASALPFGVFAQSTQQINTQSVTDVASAVETAIQSATTAVSPVMVRIIGLGVGLTLALLFVGVLIRSFRVGKGR